MSTLRVDAGELTTREMLEALEDGSRLVIRTEMLGGTHEVTLRHDGATYYCDTPTTLHKHDTSDGMRECIQRMGYASDGAE